MAIRNNNMRCALNSAILTSDLSSIIICLYQYYTEQEQPPPNGLQILPTTKTLYCPIDRKLVYWVGYTSLYTTKTGNSERYLDRKDKKINGCYSCPTWGCLVADSEYCKDKVLLNSLKSADAVLDFGGESDSWADKGRGRMCRIYQICSQATMGRITGSTAVATGLCSFEPMKTPPLMVTFQNFYNYSALYMVMRFIH